MIDLKPYAPGQYAAGQPCVEDFAELAASGVRSVINLRAPNEEIGFDEMHVVENLGMRYVLIPISGPQDLNIETIARYSNELQQALQNGKVLVHCASANRVGAMVALEQGLVQHVSTEKALSIGRAAGLAALEPFVAMMLTQHAAK